MEMGRPFPVLAPITSTVLFWIPFKEIFHLVRYPTWQFANTGTGRDMPFPVRSFIGPHTETGLHVRGPISGTGLSQFRRSFTGPCTETGLYVRGPISGMELGQHLTLRYGASGVSLSLLVTEEAPKPENKNNERSTQSRKWDFPHP